MTPSDPQRTSSRDDYVAFLIRRPSRSASLCDMRFFLEELSNEEGNGANRILCFGIPDECYREDRSYESFADPWCSENPTNS
jgi:hypothetical protein